jgi:hypothetical protein
VDQLTPQWLSSVLPGQVESVAVTATDEGTTLRARWSLDGDEHVPRSLFVAMWDQRTGSSVLLIDDLAAFVRSARRLSSVRGLSSLAVQHPRRATAAVIPPSTRRRSSPTSAASTSRASWSSIWLRSLWRVVPH